MTEQSRRPGFLRTDEPVLAEAIKTVCTPHAAPQDAALYTRAATGSELADGVSALAVIHLLVPNGTPLWRILDAIDLAAQRAKNEARWHSVFGPGAKKSDPDPED